MIYDLALAIKDDLAGVFSAAALPVSGPWHMADGGEMSPDDESAWGGPHIFIGDVPERIDEKIHERMPYVVIQPAGGDVFEEDNENLVTARFDVDLVCGVYDPSHDVQAGRHALMNLTASVVTALAARRVVGGRYERTRLGWAADYGKISPPPFYHANISTRWRAMVPPPIIPEDAITYGIGYE